MTEADIRPLLDAVPFEPFTIHLTGGWTNDIDRPEEVSFSPDGSCLYIHHAGNLRSVLSLDHAVRITYPAQPFIR
jgi:hypothetical protein